MVALIADAVRFVQASLVADHFGSTDSQNVPPRRVLVLPDVVAGRVGPRLVFLIPFLAVVEQGFPEGREVRAVLEQVEDQPPIVRRNLRPGRVAVFGWVVVGERVRRRQLGSVLESEASEDPVQDAEAFGAA